VWPGEAATKRSRILNVVYNATSNELVRTNTLVKGAIVQIDATPFRQWYEQFYRVQLGKKKEEAKDEGDSKKGIKKSEKKSEKSKVGDSKKSTEPAKKGETKQTEIKTSEKKSEKKAKEEKKAGKKSENKSEKKPTAAKEEKKEAGKKEEKKTGDSKADKRAAEKARKQRRLKALEIKKAIDSGVRKPSKSLRRKLNHRNKIRVLEQAVKEQFNTGRILARISSRPGQSGRADGYILEGDELAFYQRKIEKKKKE